MSEKPEDKKNGGSSGDSDSKGEENEVVTTAGTHKKIEVHVDRDPEIDKLQSELAEFKLREKTLTDKTEKEKLDMENEKKELQIELDELRAKETKRALDKFTEDKTALLNICKENKLPEDYIAKVEEQLATPENLEMVKGFVTMMVTALKKKEEDKKTVIPPKAPQGKAPFIPPADAESFDSDVKMIDELYNRAYYKKHNYTIQEQKDAEDKIKTMLNSLLKSPSWEQLKKGERPKMPNMISCPSCNRTIVGDIPPKCPDCGFNFSKTGDVLKGVG